MVSVDVKPHVSFLTKFQLIKALVHPKHPHLVSSHCGQTVVTSLCRGCKVCRSTKAASCSESEGKKKVILTLHILIVSHFVTSRCRSG